MTIELTLTITSIIQFCLFYFKRKSKQKFPDFYITLLLILFYFLVYPKIISTKFDNNNISFVFNFLITSILGTISAIITHLIWFIIKRKIERNS